MSLRDWAAGHWAAVVLACAAGLLAGAQAADAQTAAGSITKSAGAVSATLSWQGGEFAATAPRLTISRGGVLVSDLDVSDVCRDCTLVEDSMSEGVRYSIMQVVDLDGDGEPEVMFDTYSGGAHCCIVQRIYGYRPATSSYRRTLSRHWGNGGYTLKDLDGDGTPEISGDDDAFAYAFSSYAASVFPPRILRYTFDAATGKAAAQDLTRRFPAVVRRHAAALLKAIRRTRAADDPAHEIQGALAAYVADQYLLGRGTVGRAELARARRRKLTAPGFQTKLLAFLKRAGYR